MKSFIFVFAFSFALSTLATPVSFASMLNSDRAYNDSEKIQKEESSDSAAATASQQQANSDKDANRGTAAVPEQKSETPRIPHHAGALGGY